MTITLSDGQQYKLQKAILCATSYALGFEIEQLEKIRQEKIRQEKIRHRRVSLEEPRVPSPKGAFSTCGFR